jgi:hypothetical protein
MNGTHNVRSINKKVENVRWRTSREERSRCRWEAHIKVELRKIGCEREEVILMARNILFFFFNSLNLLISTFHVFVPFYFVEFFSCFTLSTLLYSWYYYVLLLWWMYLLLQLNNLLTFWHFGTCIPLFLFKLYFFLFLVYWSCLLVLPVSSDSLLLSVLCCVG